MGAARQMDARRYGLFTMVGIAGEDDLDAPDLLTGNSVAGMVAPDTQVARNANGGQPTGHRNGRAKPGAWTSTKQIRSPEASAAARDRMLTEVSVRPSSCDELDQWAYHLAAREKHAHSERCTTCRRGVYGKTGRATTWYEHCRNRGGSCAKNRQERPGVSQSTANSRQSTSALRRQTALGHLE